MWKLLTVFTAVMRSDYHLFKKKRKEQNDDSHACIRAEATDGVFKGAAGTWPDTIESEFSGYLMY